MTETYGSANLRVEFIDDKKGKKLKIIYYLKICTITGLVVMIVIESQGIGMNEKCGS